MKLLHRVNPIALALGSLLLAGAAHAADTIKIGMPQPMTGPNTQYGTQIQAGALTAIETINAQGGVKGKKLEAILIDDGCEPKQAVPAANRVVNSGAKFAVAHACSGVTVPAVNVYEQEGIVAITPGATSPLVTDTTKPHFFFRTIGRDDQQGPFAANYIAKTLKPKKVAVLHDKQTYGSGVASQVKNTLEKDGVNVALYEGINVGDSDYSAIITKLKSAGVDLVYFGGYHPELGLLLRQSREQGVKATFMGPEGVGNKDVTAIAGAASEGMLVTLPADFSADPANAKLVKAFADAKRDANGPFQMPSYAAVEVIANGIAGAKTTDPTKVAAYIHKSAFNTPIGKVEYDAQGDLKAFRFVVFTWHKDATKTAAN